ncbi:MAG: ACP S-malonyltransferase [bacterium]|jgi:[acyl-carrier-protein] S-malonyltransferase|nr:ACP S-malonyltransferase [Betaproteobacteria bacterium]
MTASTTPFSIVFPGQGSQSVGMMRGFADRPGVRATFDEASAALGEDLWAMVENGPDTALNATVNTQPVMLTAGVAVWREWLASGGPAPMVVAGHSLGEYSALVAAGALTLPDAVRTVRFRAQAMQEAVPFGTGAMAAILGLDDDAVREACSSGAQGEVVEAVNFNAPNQVVIAGHKAAVERAADLAKAAGAKRAVLLPVSAPFHSTLLAPAADRLAGFLRDVALSAPVIPVINNVDVACVSDPAAIRDALARQARSPVRWVETIRAVAGMGATTIIECGPGKVLNGLTRRIDGSLQGFAVVDAASLDEALKAVCA